MFENPRRGRLARNFTTDVSKILDLKSSSEQIFSENWRSVPLILTWMWGCRCISIVIEISPPFARHVDDFSLQTCVMPAYVLFRPALMPCGGSLVNLIDDCRRVMGNLGWTSVVIHRRNFSLTFSVDVICKINNNDNREVKHHLYVKRQTRICTTWPSFPLPTVHYFHT